MCSCCCLQVIPWNDIRHLLRRKSSLVFDPDWNIKLIDFVKLIIFLDTRFVITICIPILNKISTSMGTLKIWFIGYLSAPIYRLLNFFCPKCRLSHLIDFTIFKSSFYHLMLISRRSEMEVPAIITSIKSSCGWILIFHVNPQQLFFSLWRGIKNSFSGWAIRHVTWVIWILV